MNNIKKLRQELNLTQVQLAEQFALDQTTISKWELGKALPDTQTLIKLANFFDVSTDFLLGLSTYYYPDKIKEKTGATSDEKQLLEDFRSLPRQEKAQASAYVHYLAEKRGNTDKRA